MALSCSRLRAAAAGRPALGRRLGAASLWRESRGGFSGAGTGLSRAKRRASRVLAPRLCRWPCWGGALAGLGPFMQKRGRSVGHARGSGEPADGPCERVRSLEALGRVKVGMDGAMRRWLGSRVAPRAQS